MIIICCFILLTFWMLHNTGNIHGTKSKKHDIINKNIFVLKKNNYDKWYCWVVTNSISNKYYKINYSLYWSTA